MLLVSWLRRLCRPRSETAIRRAAPMPLRVTRLEHRRVLNASPLVTLHDPGADWSEDSARGVHYDDAGGVTISAGLFADDGVGDVFQIYRIDDRVEVAVNGSEVFSGLSRDVTSLTIRGSSDADRLDVNLGMQGLPVGTLRFEAGDSSATDALALHGQSVSVEHSLLGDGDGRVTAGSVSIDYDGIETLHDAVTAARRDIDLAGMDEARLGRMDGILSLEGDGLQLTVAPSSQLSIHLDDGSQNRFVVDDLGEFHGDLSINGDDSDFVSIRGRTTLRDGDLSIDAGTIAVSGSVHVTDGTIDLDASSRLMVDGSSDLVGGGGHISLNAGDAGDLVIAGRIDVSNDDGSGGEIHLLGHSVRLTGTAVIDADGSTGGGTILVGGDYQGGNSDVLNALRTTIDQGARLSADATASGDGGRIIIWSDAATHFAGTLTARGGPHGGDGGFAEVSGKQSLAFLGAVDLTAAHGAGGTLLLDPKTITVVASVPNLNGDNTTGDDLTAPGDLDEVTDQGNANSIITAAAIEALLQSGQSVVLVASDRIDIDAAINVTTGSANLTLISDVVSLDADITIGGTFEVRADNIHIDPTIAISTPGTVIFTTMTDFVEILLGGADDPGQGNSGNGQELGLTNAELATVTAALLRVGSAMSGSITVAADVTSPTTALELVSAGSITNAGLGDVNSATLSATDLLLRAGGSVQLLGHNAFGTIAGVVSTAGSTLEIVDWTGDLTVGTVAGVSGIQTTAGAVTIASNGTLFLSNEITTGGGSVAVSAIGAIELSTSGGVNVGTSSLTVIGGTLRGNGTVTGDLDMRAGTALSPGTVTTIGELVITGNLTIAAGATYHAQIIDDRTGPDELPIAGADYDRIVVGGNTTITAGAVLSLTSSASTQIDPGDAYALISSGGTITGNFTGHPNGGVLPDFGGPDVDAVVAYTNGDLILQVAGPVQFVAPAGAAGGDLRIVRNVDTVEFYVDGVLTDTRLLAAAEGITIIGQDGEDEALTVDYAGGAFGVAVTFHGGSDGNDSLILTGGTFETVTHTFESASDGQVTLEAVGVSDVIAYTGLEPILDNVSATHRVFEFTGGSETITVTDAAVAGEMTIDSTLGESVTFVIPTASLAILGGTGDDTIDVQSVDAMFTAALIVDGGAGSDEFTLSTALALGAGTVTGDFTVTAERIVLAANVRTDGGTAGGDATLNGAVELAANVTIDTDVAPPAGVDGTVHFNGTVDADAEANLRTLAVTAGGENVTWSGAIGGAERLNALTIVSANDVDFASSVAVSADLTQSAGTGTTTLRGGTIGGNLGISTNAVVFAAATVNATGTATVTAVTSILGGTADGIADLTASSITLDVTGAVGNLGVGSEATPLEIATAGTVAVDTSTGDGDVFLRAIGDLRLDVVDAGDGDATLSATGGIVDSLVGDGAGNENVIAASATLSARSGIGSADTIDVSVATLSAVNTVSGDIAIAAADAINVVLLAQQRAQPADAIPAGSILLTADGTITVSGTGIVTEGLSGISVSATGDLIVNAAVRAGTAAATEATAGDATDVLLAATRDITVAATVTAERHVTLTAGRDLTLSGAASAGQSGTAVGAILLDAVRHATIAAAGSATADGDATVNAVNGAIALAGNVAAGTAGVVRLTAATTVTQTTGGITGGSLGVLAGGSVSLLSAANDVNVFAGQANTGSLAFADADGFTLSSVSGFGEFGDVTGAVATAGNVTLRTEAGTLRLEADVTAAPTGIVRLSSGGAIDQDSGTITGEALGVRAAGAVTLDAATNDVDEFAAATTGNLVFRDADGFSVGSVASAAGFTTTTTGVSGNNVLLLADTGNLAIAEDVTATGTVRLAAELGGVTQSGGGITAQSLGVRAGDAGITLNNAANEVAVFAAASGGAIVFRDATGFTIGTIAASGGFAATSGVRSTDGNVTLQAIAGTLTLGADISTIATGTVRLIGGTGISQTAGAITAASLGVRAAGPVSLLSVGNDVDVFAAAVTAASVSFRDADDLTIGAVSAAGVFAAVTGVTSSGGDVLLIADGGDLVISEDVDAETGTVRLRAGGSVSQDAGAAITASGLGVRADGGVIVLLDGGNDVSTFAAFAGAGQIYFRDANALTVGNITAIAGPGLFAATDGIVAGVNGEIRDVLLVTGLGGAAGNGALTLASSISAPGGTVRIDADGDVTQTGGGVITNAFGVRTTSGNITLFGDNNVAVFAARSEGGSIAFADLNAVTIGQVDGFFIETYFPATTGVVSNGGAITLIAGNLSIAQNVLSDGGSILLQSDQLEIQSAVDATPAGLVQVTVRTDGGAISLGGGAGLVLDDGEIDFITARLLAIGGIDVDPTGGAAASAGRITIAGTMSPTNVANLSFLTEADVFGATANAIVVSGVLVFDVGTGVTGVGGSDGTYLGVTAAGVAGRVRNPGEFRVSSVGNTTAGIAAAIDPIAVAGSWTPGLVGVSTANGTIALEALGGSLTVDSELAVQGALSELILSATGAGSDLNLNASISSQHLIRLSASRDIVQASDDDFVIAPGVRIIAGRHVGSSLAPIDLRAGTVTGGSFSGDVYLNQDDVGGALFLGSGGNGIAGAGIVRVTTESGNLTVAGPVSGGTVQLESGTVGVGSVIVNSTVTATGSVEMTSASAITSSPGGAIQGFTINLTATDAIALQGPITSQLGTTILSTAGGVSLAAASVGGNLDVDANGGPLQVNGTVNVNGAIDFDAAGALLVNPGGSLQAALIDLTAAGAIALQGPITSQLSTTILSTGGGVSLAAASVGGNLDVDAAGGPLQVNGAVNVNGAIDFDAAGALLVNPGGSLQAALIDLTAAGRVSLSGPVTSNGLLAIESTSNSVEVLAAVSAGGVLDVDAGGQIVQTAGGSLAGTIVDLRANGLIRLAGHVASTGSTTILSVESGVEMASAAIGSGLDVDANGGGILTTGAVVVAGLLDFDAAGGIQVSAAGSLGAGAIALTAGGTIALNGATQTPGNMSALSTGGGVALSAPVKVGGQLTVSGQGGGVNVAGPVVVTGAASLAAAGTLNVVSGGTLSASTIGLTAGSGMLLAGSVTSGGNLTATATGGSIQVAANIASGGTLRLNGPAGDVGVASSGRLAGQQIVVAAGGGVVLNGPTIAVQSIDVDAGHGVAIGGPMAAGANIQVDSAAGVSIASPMSAGNLVRLRSATLHVMPGGAIGSAVVDVVAQGTVLLSGAVSSTHGTALSSLSAGIAVQAPLTSGGSIGLSAPGSISLNAPIVAGTGVGATAGGDILIGGGSVAGQMVQFVAGGGALINGHITAALDASIQALSGGLSTSATVAAGRSLMLVGAGDLNLGGTVSAGTAAFLQSVQGSVLQPSPDLAIAAPSVAIRAGGSVGQSGAAIDLAVGQVAATATGGGVWLNQQAAAGNLTLAVLGADRGVRSISSTSVSTENGNIVLAAPVTGVTVTLVANRQAGSPERGRVQFQSGYAETPTGRIVATPPRNIPVDAAGNPITKFDLASPFVLSFGIQAGNVADTVDGRLADFGTTVTVDFVQPAIFDPTQQRFQTLTDRDGTFVNGIFAPFTFQYSELFLQERLILGGAREQLFDILITAAQDDSISISEQLAGVTIVDATKQTTTFGNVATSPTEQSLTVPLGIVSPVDAGIKNPEPVEIKTPNLVTAPPTYVAVTPAQPLEVAEAESSGASAGATSADRPRLFLVWQRPGEGESSATIEIDLIWFARDYQRHLIGHLKEGRYWFELAEPGSAARQLGDSFYVRNGLVIDDPSGATPEAAGDASPPETPTPDGAFPPSKELTLPEPGSRLPEESSDDPAFTAGESAATLGLATLLGLRRRRRFLSPREDRSEHLSLGRAARLSRRVRRAVQPDSADGTARSNSF